MPDLEKMNKAIDYLMDKGLTFDGFIDKFGKDEKYPEAFRKFPSFVVEMLTDTPGFMFRAIEASHKAGFSIMFPKCHPIV